MNVFYFLVVMTLTKIHKSNITNRNLDNHEEVLNISKYYEKVDLFNRNRNLQEKEVTSCDRITDCFNCTMFSQLNLNCRWNTYKCESTDRIQTFPDFWNYFKVCVADSASYNTMRNYCGGILEKNPPFRAELINVQGNFGAKNIYCRWNALSGDINGIITVNFTKYIPNMNDQYALEVVYADGRTSTQQLQMSTYALSMQFVENVYFHFYTPERKEKLPFSLKFDYQIESGQSYLGLFISLAVIVFLCLICSILFYKCSRMIIENSNRRMQERNQAHIEILAIQRDAAVNREDEIKKRNLETLIALFEGELKPIKYDSTLNEFAANCTICLDDFKNDNLVTKLLCKHLFHSKCLKNWCEKILMHPKCPNCNESIIPNFEEEKEGENILNLNRNVQNNETNEVIEVENPRVEVENNIVEGNNDQFRNQRNTMFAQHRRVVNRRSNNETNNVSVVNINEVSNEQRNRNRENNHPNVNTEEEIVGRNNFISSSLDSGAEARLLNHNNQNSQGNQNSQNSHNNSQNNHNN